MVGKKIASFEDLDVYRGLLDLHLEVHRRTLTFPRFDQFELASQLRRSSNAIPANLAEGWNNRHVRIYLEGINRALAELRETRHHLTVASRKMYLDQPEFERLRARYDECGRMLRGLEQALQTRR